MGTFEITSLRDLWLVFGFSDFFCWLLFVCVVCVTVIICFRWVVRVSCLDFMWLNVFRFDLGCL